MIDQITEILKDCVANESLTYIETLAGLVQTETKEVHAKKLELVQRAYPIYCPVGKPCPPNKILPLVPSNDKRSLFYFERNGDVLFMGRDRGFSYFQAEVWLVGWLNPKKLGYDDCSISAPIIAQLLQIFDKGYFNDPAGVYSKMTIKPLTIKTKEPSIFQAYKYNKKFYQILEYPYDYFAIRLQINWALGDACLDDLVIQPELPC